MQKERIAVIMAGGPLLAIVINALASGSKCTPYNVLSSPHFSKSYVGPGRAIACHHFKNPPSHPRTNAQFVERDRAHLNCGERTAKALGEDTVASCTSLARGPGLVFALTFEIDIWQLVWLALKWTRPLRRKPISLAFSVRSDEPPPVRQSQPRAPFGCECGRAAGSHRPLSSVVEWFYYRHNRAGGNPARAASSESQGIEQSRAQELYLRCLASAEPPRGSAPLVSPRQHGGQKISCVTHIIVEVLQQLRYASPRVQTPPTDQSRAAPPLP